MAETIAGTHCAYPRRNGQVSGPEWLDKYRDGRPTKGHQYRLNFIDVANAFSYYHTESHTSEHVTV